MNKTISINPSLFSLSSNKTKKKKKNDNKPIINPNIIKTKLLNRIKQHKQKETKHLDSNNKNRKKKVDENKENNDNKNNNSIEEENSFTDDFNESLKYLQNLSKKHEQSENLKQREIRKQKIQNQTVKNYQNSYSKNDPIQQGIQIDLPDDFYQNITPIKPTSIKVTPELPTISIKPPINIPINTHEKITTFTKTNIQDDVPYGILKNGSKPTYRIWNKTQKNNTILKPSQPIINNHLSSEREQKLALLKNKIKEKPNIELPIENKDKTVLRSPSQMNTNLDLKMNNINETIHTLPVKKIIKKTINKKYILGKSKTKRKISILLKSHDKRKEIINACKDIRKQPINKIKQYLREHNLIKIGCSAPNDVLRKLYESALLTGEITNNNKETLMDNFLNEQKENNF